MLQILYNNCDGLKINDIIQGKTNQSRSKKKDKYIRDLVIASKLGGILGTTKTWLANFTCLAETQTGWEIHTVYDVTRKGIKALDEYGTIVGSSSIIPSASYVKSRGTMTVTDGDWSSIWYYYYLKRDRYQFQIIN